MVQVLLDPAAIPRLLPRAKNGKACLSACVAPGQTIVHPLTGEFKLVGVNSMCPTLPYKKNGKKKYFDRCNYSTPGLISWLPMSHSGKFNLATPRGLYRFILASEFKIFNKKQAKAWLNTVTSDPITIEQVRWLSKIAFGKKKRR